MPERVANFTDVALFKGYIVRFLLVKQPDVPNLRELTARKIDVVYGGPPCQCFSQIGPRNQLAAISNHAHRRYLLRRCEDVIAREQLQRLIKAELFLDSLWRNIKGVPATHWHGSAAPSARPRH